MNTDKSLTHWQHAGRLLLIALMIATSSPFVAYAKPAPWVSWQSVTTGEWLCSQTSPGPGWIKGKNEFDNPKCEAQPLGTRKTNIQPLISPRK